MFLSCEELKMSFSPFSPVLLVVASAYYSTLSQSERCPSHILVRNVLRRNNGLDFVEVEEFVPYCDYWYHQNSTIQSVCNETEIMIILDRWWRQCGKLCKNVMQLLVGLLCSKTPQQTWRFWPELTDRSHGMINAVRFHIYVVCDYLER